MILTIIIILFIALMIWIITGYLQDMAKHYLEYQQAIQEENKGESNQINLIRHEYHADHLVVNDIKNMEEEQNEN